MKTMQHKSNLIARITFTCALLINMTAQAQNFTFETWNNSNTPVITVSQFSSVAVDKLGKIWAGSSLGGLYCYRNNEWVKIGTYPDITFRQIVPSNIPGDNNLWAASIGKTGAQAVNGGAYQINAATETATQYNTTNSGLGSRYGNSIAYSSQGRVYVALAQSITASTIINQGGVYSANTVNPTSFTKAIFDNTADDILYQSAGNRGEELWFGRSGYCKNGVCSAAYIARINSSGATLPSITNANSPLPFTNSSSSSFARAIYTDSVNGNTFVGLNSGGVGVYRREGSWVLLTSSNSPFPAGAAVNFNAITEVYGEVWIGTTAGIFVYDGKGLPDNAASYKLLSTANGVAGSITGIAVDTAKGYLWVAGSSGISRTPYTPSKITGKLYDVYINNSPVEKDASPSLSATFYKEPIIDKAVIKLLENGVELETAKPDANGQFELTKGLPGKTYSVQIEYTPIVNKIKYQYDNIRYNKYFGAVNFPGLLINDIKAFKENMKKRCFELKTTFEIKAKILCSDDVDAFDVSTYDHAYEKFISPEGITTDHIKAVESLADFYVSLATIYDMGGNASELNEEAFSDLWDFITSWIELRKVSKAFDQKAFDYPKLRLLDYFENNNTPKFMIDKLQIEYDKVTAKIKSMSATISDAETKQRIDHALGILDDTFGTLMKLAETGSLKEAAVDLLLNSIKKAAASAWVAVYYYERYAGMVHKNSVQKAAEASFSNKYTSNYENAYNTLYNSSNPNSNAKKAATIKDESKTIIEGARTGSKYANYVSSLTTAASVIAGLIPGTQPAAPILYTISRGAAAASVAAKAFSFLTGVTGVVRISNASELVLPSVGVNFKSGVPYYNRNTALSSISTQLLVSVKSNYTQKLTELKNMYNASPFDTMAYIFKYNEVIFADSVYNKELTKTLNYMWATADSANIYVSGFDNKLKTVIDSFVTVSMNYKTAFDFKNIGYLMDNCPSSLNADLISSTDSLVLLSDSAVNGIVELTSDINNNNVPAPAYLVQDGYILNHNHQPGSNGSFTYKFTNYGAEAINDVSFKLGPISAGYTITGSDSVHFASITAGETKQVTFNFHAASTDSLGQYTIAVKAANGKYRNVAGSLFVFDPTKNFSVKDGNWSDVNTWSNNTVPVNTTNVVINHAVVVDVDATCKSITATIPGTVSVNAGKKLNVLK